MPAKLPGNDYLLTDNTAFKDVGVIRKMSILPTFGKKNQR
jgi:hypothetical protein